MNMTDELADPIHSVSEIVVATRDVSMRIIKAKSDYHVANLYSLSASPYYEYRIQWTS